MQSLPEKGQGDYQYLLPLDDERAMQKVNVADKIIGRIIERDTDNPVCRRQIGKVLVRTHDDRGPISGLSGTYMHSKGWQYPFSKCYLSGIGIKTYKAKGNVKAYDRWGCEHGVHVEIDTGMTVTEMKNNPGELRRIVEEAANNKLREKMAEQRDEDERVAP